MHTFTTSSPIAKESFVVFLTTYYEFSPFLPQNGTLIDIIKAILQVVVAREAEVLSRIFYKIPWRHPP
jgi:hypothetical protein